MAIDGVAGLWQSRVAKGGETMDKVIEGERRRGAGGNDGRNWGIWDFPAGWMAGWGESEETKIGCLSDLSNRGFSSITM